MNISFCGECKGEITTAHPGGYDTIYGGNSFAVCSECEAFEPITLKGIKLSEIKSEEMICPYCSSVAGSRNSCCGEIHFERGFQLKCGDIVLESEVIILEDQ